MTMHLYSDESKVDGYRFAGALVAGEDVRRVRREALTWRVGSSHRFHTSHERPEARERALASLLRMAGTVEIAVVEHPKTHPEFLAREACVAAMATWAGGRGVTRWLLERDGPSERRDRQTIARLIRTGAVPRLHYGHAPGVAEPLLWVADLAAWMWTRGGEHREALAPLIVHHEVAADWELDAAA
ncbi:hypothetical protein [Demequina mangrovi]|uniref:DUF3800 domain-containing protein n=1 Tax=Demequina mangrovi TaxID=1043493 RepID=A0A1H6ZHW8_9MICO|nr:hypothetical protein [Demequina mangrovi]SEJ51107.1 hypothetical protein SAMN05421637_2079 [Demequina mangrovi]